MSKLSSDNPKAVEVSFKHLDGSNSLVVTVRDIADGILFTDTKDNVSEWLKIFNYRYQTGSNGVWCRQ